MRHSPRRTVVALDAGFCPIKEGVLAAENGETHFRDIDIEISEVGPDGTTSKRLPATGIYFRTTPADWFFDCRRLPNQSFVGRVYRRRPSASVITPAATTTITMTVA